MMFRRLLVLPLLLFYFLAAGQPQDINFSITSHLLAGKKILKVKRDFSDSYAWVLAQNNQVFRINSLTLAVDDYTAKFASYSSEQFIDIAGCSPDIVFIATSTPLVIEYNNNTLSEIGPAQGLTDAVTSIGLSFYFGTLSIATVRGLGQYDITANQLTYYVYPSFQGPTEIFSATYRTEMNTGSYTVPSSQYPGEFFTPGTGYDFEIENYQQSGSAINTGFFTLSNSDYPSLYFSVFGGSYFWGNQNGLWQEWLDKENDYPAFYHYMDNININKIADILGTVSFNGRVVPGNFKDNLLIGTDRGFYFSSSLNKNTGVLNNFSLTFFSTLGNLPVYDVCTNATANTEYELGAGSCENGVWLGTANGVYLLTADYASYFQSTDYVNDLNLSTPTTGFITNVSLCQGGTITPTLNTAPNAEIIQQWEKNGQAIPGATQNSLTINAAGEYYAILYDPCNNIRIQTNHIIVQTIAAPVFTFNYPDKIPECGTTPVTFEVTNNPAYQYRWYTNDQLNGNTTSSYTATQSGTYKVEVSSCEGTWIPSKEVEVDMVTLPAPQIMPDKQQYCAEDVAKLTINTPADPSYTINWYEDGTLIPANINQTTITATTAGNYTAELSSNITSCLQTSAAFLLNYTAAPVFTFNYPDQVQYCAGTPVTLTATGSATYQYQYQWFQNDVAIPNSTGASFSPAQSGKYKVEVSSCPGSSVPSKEVQVNFISIAAPKITTDKPAYCQGDNATLTTNVASDPSYTINWYQNGNLMSQAANRTSIITANAGSYTVSVTESTPNTDGSTCSAISASQVVSFNPPPSISIQQTASSGFCEGQTVTLLAQHSDGTVQWSDGETGDQIQVTQTGTYTATVTTAVGCQNSATSTVTIFPDPAFTISDATICTYENKPITLTAPAGYAAYSWDNGASDQPTYQVSRPGTVRLTVTDANGCQATRQVNVTEQCPDVHIPNTFTPNGDGINDTWDIEGLDASATVKVFTRWGTEVYQSAGYSTPWNGEYDGKRLPAGVYYYIVIAKNNTQKFDGSVTIIY